MGWVRDLISSYQTHKLSTLTIDGRVRYVASHVLREVLPSLFMRSAQRPTIFRIQAILARLVAGEKVTARSMATLLEVSERTVARDIDYLVNALHVPMAYDFKRKSYILVGPVPTLFALPASITDPTREATSLSVVELAVDPSLESSFRAMNLHPSQEYVETATGLHIRLTLPLSDALEQWILGFGTRIRVIAPEQLRNRVVQIAREIVLAFELHNNS